MIFSQTSQYALRAVYYLLSTGDDKWHLTKDIAEATKIPGPYLARIMSSLAKRGILKSRTGMGGGFKISSEGLKHSLYDVVSQFDNLTEIKDCAFGLTVYCESKKCLLHDEWIGLKEQLIKLLESHSLADLKNAPSCVDWTNIKTQ